LDHKLKPYLIEVNHLSSFGTDSPLDKKIKFDLITDTINLLNLSIKRKRKTKQDRAEQFSRRMHKDGQLTKQMRDEIRQQNQEERDRYEIANLGGFRRCFPSEDPTLQEKYDELLV